MDLLIAQNTVTQAQSDQAPATGTPGWATDGNPATNTPATIFPAYAFNALQAELTAAIQAAGIALDRTKLNQLASAIQKMTQGAAAITSADTGAANAYAITLSPVPSALTAGMMVAIDNIVAANTGASTLNVNGLGALPIQLPGGSALTGGELRTGYGALLRLNHAGTAWILLNSTGKSVGATPAAGDNSTALATTAFANAIGFTSVSASVAANALTAALQPVSLNFRNPTLTSGAPVQASIANSLSLTVPSGATLGTVSGQQARLVWLVAYNGGTPVLCVTNLAGGLNLDETTLISPTTISGTATAANVIYSASAVSANSPFRVVGFADVTEATAGTWATAPTTVQGIGGQALAAMQSLGYGQTWQSVSGSFGVTRYNTTGKPIFTAITVTTPANSAGASLSINGFVVGQLYGALGTANPIGCELSGVVPVGGSYSLDQIGNGGASVLAWSELR